MSGVGQPSVLACASIEQLKIFLLTVGNDRHVTDVGRVVHETTDLVALLVCCCVSAGVEYHRIGAGCCARKTYLLGGEAEALLASLLSIVEWCIAKPCIY